MKHHFRFSYQSLTPAFGSRVTNCATLGHRFVEIQTLAPKVDVPTAPALGNSLAMACDLHTPKKARVELDNVVRDRPECLGGAGLQLHKTRLTGFTG